MRFCWLLLLICAGCLLLSGCGGMLPIEADTTVNVLYYNTSVDTVTMGVSSPSDQSSNSMILGPADTRTAQITIPSLTTTTVEFTVAKDGQVVDTAEWQPSFGIANVAVRWDGTNLTCQDAF